MLGTEPRARRQCEPSTVRPSVRVTVTTSPARVTDSIRDFDSTFMPRRVSTSSSTAAASASSPGSTRSRRETRVTVDAEGEVRRRELRAGHAGADHDQLVGHLVEVVDLLPGQDPLAVGLRGGQDPRRGTGGDQDGVGVEGLLAARRASRPRPARGRPGGRGPRATRTPSFSSRRAMSSRLRRRRARLTRWLTRARSTRLVAVALAVGQSTPSSRRRRRRSSARRSRSGSCWARSR